MTLLLMLGGVLTGTPAPRIDEPTSVTLAPQAATVSLTPYEATVELDA